MKVVRGSGALERPLRDGVLTVGNFDGLHLGHQAILRTVTGRARAMAFAGPVRPHSLPGQHGWYVALWTVVPALLFLVAWGELSGNLIYGQVLASPEAANLPGFATWTQSSGDGNFAPPPARTSAG